MNSIIKNRFLLLIFVFSFLTFFGIISQAHAATDPSTGYIYCQRESYWELVKTGAATGGVANDDGSTTGYSTLVPIHSSTDTSYDMVSPFTAGATLRFHRRVADDPVSPITWDTLWTTYDCTTGPLDGDKCSVTFSAPNFFPNQAHDGDPGYLDDNGDPACEGGTYAFTVYSPPNRISAPVNYAVTASAGTGGSVSSPCTVASGNTSATCSNVVASGGYTINPLDVTFNPSNCAVAGSFSGSTYTTGQVNANCNVNFTFTPVGTVNGYHDGASGNQASTSCNAFGWAAFSTQPATDLIIRILSDGASVYYSPPGTGAGEYRSDLTGQCTGGTCAFNVDLSGRISSGVNHSITVQAQNPDTSAWTTIGGSPKTLNCAAAPVAPSTPTGLTATAGACGTGTIAVSWTVSSGATSYTLRDGATTIYTGAATSFNHTGLTAGSSHSYTVLATNSAGSSAYSSAVSRTAPALCAGMSGTLTASNCTILSGASSCNSSLNWSTTNPVGTSAVTTPTNITVANGNSGSTTYVRTPPGDRNFYLYNNSQLLSTATSTATCAAGNIWDGSKCATVPSAPDLMAAAPTPSAATVNTAQTFSSTISNIGTASTGASFSNFFQVATAANGGGTITDLASTTMTTLAAGGTGTATKSYTFASAGTYSVRACADKTNAASAGVITESNEGNNCSAWTNVSVSATNTAPVGYVDGANCSNLWGWTFDPDTSSTPISYHLYKDGPYPAGTFVGSYLANSPRPDINTAYGISGDHGFMTPTPASLKDGIAHPLYFYAIDSAGGSNPLLAPSPRSITCAAPVPDLTASNPTPTTATVGVAQIFSSTITNNGTGSTGASFTNLFQTSPSSTGASGVIDYPVSGMATLAAGASASTSKSITFSSPGTIYIRACADKSSAADVNGTITESNEGNNCSISNPWTAVTVSSPPPSSAPVVTIWASPSTGTVNVINPTILWSVTNTPTSCTASGDWSGSRGASGTQSQGVLTSVKTYKYKLTCLNASGTGEGTANVIVSAASSGVTISLNPTSIYAGDSSQLTWAGPGSCAGTNFDTGGSPGNTISVSPSITTTYSVTCDGISNQATLIVKKKPIFIEN